MTGNLDIYTETNKSQRHYFFYDLIMEMILAHRHDCTETPLGALLFTFCYSDFLS